MTQHPTKLENLQINVNFTVVLLLKMQPCRFHHYNAPISSYIRGCLHQLRRRTDIYRVDICVSNKRSVNGLATRAEYVTQFIQCPLLF